MERLGDYEVHQFANLFPMSNAEDFDGLKEDIKKNGLLEPIWLFGGKVLDGRNRLKACQETQVKPVFRDYEGDAPLDFVISLNLKRRHLNASQRAAVAVDSLPLFEAQAKERQIRKPADSVPQKIGEQNKHESESATKAGKVFGVNRQYVAEAKRIKETNPEAFEQIRSGTKTVSEVKVEEKKEERAKKIEQIREEAKKVQQIKDQKYDVITIDPPWTYEINYHPNQIGATQNPYPSMSIDQIKKLQIPGKENSIIWLWVTQSSIQHAFEILKIWGYEYKVNFVWKKPGFGAGIWLRSQHETVILATKGKPIYNFEESKKVGSVFEAKRREHSRKPDEFYEMVDLLCPGTKLDMFAREPREGWHVWGAETNKFNEVKD